MKVKILRSNLIELLPESDSDFALLHLWSEQHDIKIASSTYQNSQTTELRIGFQSNPPKKQLSSD